MSLILHCNSCNNNRERQWTAMSGEARKKLSLLLSLSCVVQFMMLWSVHCTDNGKRLGGEGRRAFSHRTCLFVCLWRVHVFRAPPSVPYFKFAPAIFCLFSTPSLASLPPPRVMRYAFSNLTHIHTYTHAHTHKERFGAASVFVVVFVVAIIALQDHNTMEGNFYVSDVVIDREMKSKYGKAYVKCPNESKRYGECIESSQINRNLQRNSCTEERHALRACVSRHLREDAAASRVK